MKPSVFLTIAALVLATIAVGKTAGADERALIGSGKLVSYEDRDPPGHAGRPFGDAPAGLLV